MAWPIRESLLLAGLGALMGLGLHWQVERAQAMATRPPAAVTEGSTLYSAECAICHGLGGNGGGGAPALDDGQVVRQYPTPQQLAHFIRSNMPATAPGTLTETEARSLALYVESLNRPLTMP